MFFTKVTTVSATSCDYLYQIVAFISLIIPLVNCNQTVGNVREYAVDIYNNITIPCKEPLPSRTELNHHEITSHDIMWAQEGRHGPHHFKVLEDGSMMLINVDKLDAGIYSCNVDSNEGVYVRDRVNLKVRSVPPLLANVTIHPSTILALIVWEVRDDGGYPIIHFTAEYKLAHSNESWRPISPNHISPNSRQVEVYKLEPNTTYTFRIWGRNEMGAGPATEVNATTLHSIEEIELAKHLLEGAEKFDTRVWVAAVSIVMGTLVVLSIGTCYLLYIECNASPDGFNKLQYLELEDKELEGMELVPNIILNPGYQEDKPPDVTRNARAASPDTTVVTTFSKTL